MKKRITRMICLMVCMAMVSSASACELLLSGDFLGSYDYSKFLEDLYPSSKDEESSSKDTSSSNQNNENSSGTNVEIPPASEPDPEKELLKKETDSLGHEIAYYTDGSWEDLGRVTPIDFTPEAPMERMGYQALLKEEDGAILTQFYMDIYEQLKEFFASDANVSMDSHGYYSLSALDTSEYGLSMNQLTSVWGTVKQDYPEFYWLSNGVYSLGNRFYVSIDEEYAKGSERERIQTAIEKAALECDAYINGVMSEAERAVIIHDYIVAEIDYAYESDGVTPKDANWAHNIAGWALYDSGVCETYAETFTYLCNLFDLESSVVIGVAAQSGTMNNHAWSILQVEDEWHAVDLTWNDGFKNDSKLVSREWFGVPATEFAKTHAPYVPENGWGIYYQFSLPTLSEKPLSPVLYNEVGGGENWIVSIDDAFSKMTKQGGRYEMKLYPNTKVLTEKGITLYPDGASFSAALPKVASLSIQGDFVYTDRLAGIGYMPRLDSINAVTLRGSLELDCVYLYTPSYAEGLYRTSYKNSAQVYLVKNI